MRGRELGDDLVEALLERGIGVRCQRIRGGLERLVNVRVHEDRPGEPAGGPGRGQLEVPDVARFLEHLEVQGQRGGSVDLLARAPERVVDLDIGERDRAKLQERGIGGK